MPDESSISEMTLLTDSPVRRDAFHGGGHERVAEALADLIRDEKGGKAIALQGPYGSGKSSVVEMLEDKVEQDGETRIFTYDAWEHEGDPLRRSFLESLIDFLLEPFSNPRTGRKERWADGDQEEKWKDIKEKLAGRTETTIVDTEPKLTNRGRLTLVLLFLAPLGILLANNFITDFWGNVQTSPLKFSLWVGGLVLVVAPLAIIGYTYWSAEEGEELFYLLVRETREEEETKTIKTPDPTTIEFQNYFEEVLRGVLEENDRQLIFVVDNLDRLRPEQALSTWATMRTFFDKDTESKQNWTDRFWLIVPFNPEGLLPAFKDTGDQGSTAQTPTETKGKSQGSQNEIEVDNKGHADGGGPEDNERNKRGRARRQLQAFIDKTFTTTFRVAPPVLSDWGGYMKSRLAEAFEVKEEPTSDQADDFHAVYRIYKELGTQEGRIPTPRDIKLFINRLCALHRQWKTEIQDPDSDLKLPIMAAFDLKSGDISRSGHEIKTSTLLDTPVERELRTDEWDRMFAALHFNVSPDDSIEVLIEEEVREALESGEADGLKDLSDVSGFNTILDEVVAGIVARGNPSTVSRAAAALEGLEIEDGAVHREAWKKLQRAAIDFDSWSPESKKEGRGCVSILRNASNWLHDQVARALLLSFSKTDLSGNFHETPNAATKWTDGVVPVVRYLLERGKGDLVEEKLRVPHGWPSFLSALEGLAIKEDSVEIASFMKPAKGMEAGGVSESISDVISSGSFRPSQAEAIHLMRFVEGVSDSTDWVGPVNAIGNRLDRGNSHTTDELRALLKAALLIGEVHGDDRIGSKLFDRDGKDNILHYLSENQEHKEIASLCVLLSVLHNPRANTGRGRGNASEGSDVLQEVLDNPNSKNWHIQLVEKTAAITRRYGIAGGLLRTANDHQNARDFVHSVIRKIAGTEDALDHLGSSAILQHPGVLKESLDQGSFTNLLELAVANGDLLERLGGLTVEKWEKKLLSEDRLLDVVLGLTRVGSEIGLGSSYQDALRSHAEYVLEGTHHPSRLGTDWPDLLNGLDASAKDTLLQRIQKLLIEKCDQPISSLLTLYLDPLLGSDAIEKVGVENPNDAVRERFSEVVQRSDPEELKWLSSTLSAKPDLERVDPAVWEDFQNRVVEEYKTAEGPVRSHLEEIARQVEAELPSEETDSE